MNEKDIVRAVAAHFPSFGGGHVPNDFNPVHQWMKDSPPVFAFGVPIEDVVMFVLQRAKTTRTRKPRP